MEPLTFSQKYSPELILVCKHDFDQAPGVNHEKQVLDIQALRLVHEVDNFAIIPPAVVSERAALWSHQKTESGQRRGAFKLRWGDFCRVML